MIVKWDCESPGFWFGRIAETPVATISENSDGTFSWRVFAHGNPSNITRWGRGESLDAVQTKIQDIVSEDDE